MKDIYVLIVSFPDEESMDGSCFEQIVSSHATHELAVSAGDLYAAPYEVKEVSFYE